MIFDLSLHYCVILHKRHDIKLSAMERFQDLNEEAMETENDSKGVILINKEAALLKKKAVLVKKEVSRKVSFVFICG